MADTPDNSEERPLDPTERRLQTAREEGQFPQSRDLTTLIVLLAFGATLMSLAGWYGQLWTEVVSSGLRLGSPDLWMDHLYEWASGPLLTAGLWLLALLLPAWLLSMLGPLALVRALSPAAAAVELHEHTAQDGMMMMRPVQGPIPMPAEGPLVFQPGGYHVMLIGLRAPLSVGDTVPVSLLFDDGSAARLQLPVAAP